MSGAYAYGNTRLRARRTAFLGRDWVLSLLPAAPATVWAELARSPYAVPDQTRGAGRDRPGEWLERIRRVGRDRRHDACRFYAQQAGQLVALLLLRRERAALLAVLRGARAGQRESTADLLEPTPRLPGAVLTEAAEAADLPTAVAVLARHASPDRHTATAARAALAEFALRDDWAAFETAVVLAHTEGAVDSVRRFGPDGPVAQVVAAEVDADNVLAVARARTEQTEGPPALLPGGLLPAASLAPLAGAAEHRRLATVVGRTRPTWRPPLELWAQTLDAAALQRDLEQLRYRAARSLWTSGDPLGPAVPAAYLAGVDAEEHDLRLLIATTTGRLPAAEARERVRSQ